MEAIRIIDSTVKELTGVVGIEAIVLGGSRARSTHTPVSDVDLGIYYNPMTQLDIRQLQQVATRLDDHHREGLVTEPGGWGPWINGGGWLTIEGQAVDLIYRDLDKVAGAIRDGREGRFETVYQPGHPFAFISYIYLSEVALCQPLWDPLGTIQELKSLTNPYPPQLRQVIFDTYWWEVDFSLKVAEKSIKTGDVTYAAGCCFRCVACLAQTLFALNNQYWMNEKGAIAIADGFEKSPTHLKERVENVFGKLNPSPDAISTAIRDLYALVEDCKQFMK